MQAPKRLVLALLPAALTLASCGVEPGTQLINEAQTQDDAALLPSRVIDLDALYGHPDTQTYAAAAAEPGSPCGGLLQQSIKLGEELGPAIAAKNYAVVATHLPEILATMKELFACVKVVKAKQGQSSSLPASPAVPAYKPRLNPCVTVIWHGDSGATCP